jgi:predicted nucleic acid-binding protein
MTYLVDANVLSEPTKTLAEPQVVDWLAVNERDCVVDAIILGEIGLGIFLLPRGRKRAKLEQWFDRLANRVECLPWDDAVSRRWAELVANLRRRGLALPVLDSMIAATALAHRLTLVTRNVRDFRKAGIPVLDPFV